MLSLKEEKRNVNSNLINIYSKNIYIIYWEEEQRYKGWLAKVFFHSFYKSKTLRDIPFSKLNK